MRLMTRLAGSFSKMKKDLSREAEMKGDVSPSVYFTNKPGRSEVAVSRT